MIMKSTQKIIKIGDSAGVTIPAKDMKRDGMKVGDEITFGYQKPQPKANNDVILAAQDILKRYKKDFENLAQR